VNDRQRLQKHSATHNIVAGAPQLELWQRIAEIAERWIISLAIKFKHNLSAYHLSDARLFDRILIGTITIQRLLDPLDIDRIDLNHDIDLVRI
jgi:hypothetical protein